MLSLNLLGPTMALALARGSQIATNFVLVPIALTYMGDSKYGLWMAFSSAILMLASFADGGISNGLISSTARANQSGDRTRLSSILSSGLVLITLISILLLIVFLPIGYFTNLSELIELGENVKSIEVTLLFSIVIITLCITMPVNVTLKFRTGLSRIIGVGLWDTAAAVSILPSVLLVRYLDLGFIWFVAAALLAPVFVKIIGSTLFLLHNNTATFSRTYFSKSTAKSLLNSGFAIFTISFAQAIAINADQMIIAILASPAEASPYSILNRLFLLPFMIVNLLLTVLWPKFSANKEAGNFQWIKKTFHQMLVVSSLFTFVASILIYLNLSLILNLWINRSFEELNMLILGMFFYGLVVVLVGLFNTFFMSMELHRPLVIMSVAMLLMNLPLTIYLVSDYAAAGAIWASVISYMVCNIVPSIYLIHKALKHPQNTLVK